MEQSMFDLPAAEAARDAAIEQVKSNADAEWYRRALDIVRGICERQTEFNTDWLWSLIEHPRESRAAGALMRDAARAGYCKATGRYQKSLRKTCHARPLMVWESLIYKHQHPPRGGKD